MPPVKRKAGTATRRPRRFGTGATATEARAKPMREVATTGSPEPPCQCGDPTCEDTEGEGYYTVYRPKGGVETFTGIVAVAAAVIETPWQRPPLSLPVSYFMLRDRESDPMRGDKELMSPEWFMREMSQYDGHSPR